MRGNVVGHPIVTTAKIVTAVMGSSIGALIIATNVTSITIGAPSIDIPQEDTVALTITLLESKIMTATVGKLGSMKARGLPQQKMAEMSTLKEGATGKSSLADAEGARDLPSMERRAPIAAKLVGTQIMERMANR